MSIGADCPRCGHTRAEVQVTTVCSDFDVPIHEGLLLIDRDIIQEIECVDVEVICANCGYAKQVANTEWSWA
jgi:ribosomal protein L37E